MVFSSKTIKYTVVYHRLSDVRLSAFENFRQHPQIVRFGKFLGNYSLFRHFFCKNRKFCYFSACFYVDLVCCVKFSYCSIVFAVIRKILLKNGSFDWSYYQKLSHKIWKIFHRLSVFSTAPTTDCPFCQKKANKKADNLWYTTVLTRSSWNVIFNLIA